jgi:BolA protein
MKAQLTFALARRYPAAMSVTNRITDKLADAFAPTILDVQDESHLHKGHAGHREGGETHFRVHIVSPVFAGKSRLERHRMVNAALADEIHPAGIHALAIRARTPGEI